MINDILKKHHLFIIIEYLIVIMTFSNLLFYTLLPYDWCEHSEHQVRMNGTYRVVFGNKGADFWKNLYMPVDFKMLVRTLGTYVSFPFLLYIRVSAYLCFCVFKYLYIQTLLYLHVYISVLLGICVFAYSSVWMFGCLHVQVFL